MRTWIPAFLLIACNTVFAQDAVKGHWKIEAGFDYSICVGGYVQVREFDFEGTHLSLINDLGMSSMNTLSLQAAREFRNGSQLAFYFEYFFLYGTASPDKNIMFNATELHGPYGLTVNTSNLYRGEIFWDTPLRIFSSVTTTLGAGLIWDGLIFRIRGTVTAQSPHNEPKEDFISQSLPYPELGFGVKKTFSKRSSISLDARGTYIPLFKSFFMEGGNMWLNYATVNALLGYTWSDSHFYFTPAIHYRLIKTYENSNEDTNDFYMNTMGVKIVLGWRF
jgi:hypothetical protein